MRLPTHTRMIGATYTTLSDPFYETINDEIQMQIKSNGDLLLVRDPGQDSGDGGIPGDRGYAQ